MVAAADTEEPADLIVFAQELASRLRVFKLILLDRQGGLTDATTKRIPSSSLAGSRATSQANVLPADARDCARSRARCATGSDSVNLVAPREVYEELFSFIGTGTLFTEQPLRHRPADLDRRFRGSRSADPCAARTRASCCARSREKSPTAALCFGYRVGDEHLAGVCALLTEPYRRERAGEITGLYTLTRFLGEGVASELVKEVSPRRRRAASPTSSRAPPRNAPRASSAVCALAN